MTDDKTDDKPDAWSRLHDRIDHLEQGQARIEDLLAELTISLKNLMLSFNNLTQAVETLNDALIEDAHAADCSILTDGECTCIVDADAITTSPDILGDTLERSHARLASRVRQSRKELIDRVRDSGIGH